jgi:hypothetical protein
MVVKSKQSESNVRWRPRGRVGHKAARPVAPAPEDVMSRERRAGGGASEDRALYSCECGYAFEALVTTSVGCPHCARTQAW